MEITRRGRRVFLPLTGTPFQVPSNVFIIGTMNTADRSIALLDTALRRRFGFKEFMPDSTLLGPTTLEGIPLASWLDILNQRICKNLTRDARNLQIGHSYLMEKDKAISDFSRFRRALREDIFPLLEEYCYEDFDKLEQILGRGLVEVENQRFREELFQPGREGQLVTALLAMDEALAEVVTEDEPEETPEEEDSDEPETSQDEEAQ
jgi:5-methylcytosine-specific restriction protein B